MGIRDPENIAEQWAASAEILTQALKLREEALECLKALLESAGAQYYLLSDVVTVHDCKAHTAAALIDEGFDIIARVETPQGPKVTFGCGE